MTGVLVLVEQHDAEALPQLRPDRGERRRQPGGRRHLHAEVHHLLGPHTPVQRVDQRHELGALRLGGKHPQQPLARAAVALIRTGGQRVHEPFQLDVGVGQRFGVDEVLGQLARQPQHHCGDGGGRLLRVECAGMFGDDAKSQLPQLCFAEQPGIGLDRQQQAVLAQQRARECVIGADGRGVVGRVEPAGDDPRAREPGQPGANPAQQLTRRLTGERQAEHLTRRGIAVGHQPHHARGHRLGLARTGTGDHHQRPRRSGDDRRLFVGRREKPESRGQFVGAVLRCS